MVRIAWVRSEMGIAHRCGDVAVPEQFLDGTQINSAHHPLCRPEMTEVMKADPVEANFLAARFERPPRIDPTIAGIEPGKDMRTADHTNERVQPLDRIVGKRNVTWLSAFRKFD